MSTEDRALVEMTLSHVYMWLEGFRRRLGGKPLDLAYVVTELREYESELVEVVTKLFGRPTINEVRAEKGVPPLPEAHVPKLSPTERALIEDLIRAAQHPEHPAGDPPVCAKARQFLARHPEE